MAANKDAIRVNDPSPASDSFPVRTAGRKGPLPPPTPPRSSLAKLLAFGKASEEPMDDFPSERKITARTIWMIAAAVSVVALIAAAFVLMPRWRANVPSPQLGQLVIDSQPAGAEVLVDGVRRGVTPLTLTLAGGSHALQLTRDTVTRNIPVTIKPGAEVIHHIDLETRAVVPDVGQLLVTSEPSGARVTVDGQPRGVTPVTIPAVPAGQHAVVIHGDAGSVQRAVTIERGQTASLVVSMNQAAFGWVSIASPVVMQILENDRRLGTSETDRIMMPAGRHTLKIVNTRLGYQRSEVVQVPAGGAANLKISVPDGVVNLNALPWAEAWVDGRRLGETPLGNLKLPIGEHEAIFRHPQFGERRQTFVVTANEPTRVAVDLRK
jgi:PEGA domain-containing protein